MHRIKATVIVMVLFALTTPNALGISRVAKRLNLLEVYGGVGIASGEYDGLPNIPFVINSRAVDVSASDIYGSAYHLGISYGQLKNRHYLVTAGFQFTENSIKDAILVSNTVISLPPGTKARQYDLTLGLNYMLWTQYEQPWTPYFGLGLKAGIASLSFRDFATENEANVAIGFNFGADLRLWQDDEGRSPVTLSSINNWEFVTTNNRPAYLQIGGGIRYWFRP